MGQRALDMLIESCKNANTSRCYLAGIIYDNNAFPNWLKDSASKAQYYYRLGCELGYEIKVF